jgi:crotonobetainyl-CoA:carnitine CoA-transferase CaiB-like acyl-CoA transferase
VNGEGGPLDGLRVVELASEHAAFAGKMLGDLGADVIVIEPPGGHPSRAYGPFADDVEDPERSLWWWHYNTSKRGIVLDLDTDDGAEQFRRLAAEADIVLEGEAPDALATRHLDHPHLRAGHEELIWVSVTPFGRTGTRAHEPATDLTILAGGGPVWSCGYDDHELPPVRGGGNQGFHAAGNWAVMSVLVALLHREETGRGQHIDVSMHASSNVTTELATYGYLACGVEVQRQTGRHATPVITAPTQVRCRDGHYVNTGVPPRSPADFANVLDLLDRLGLRDEFPMSGLLELGAQHERLNLADIEIDPVIGEIFGAAREVLLFLAENLDAYDFFVETQRIGIATGVVYTPAEAMADPHFVERGFPVEIEHPELGRSFTYPGAPYRFTVTPWSARRAPLLGEHQEALTSP